MRPTPQVDFDRHMLGALQIPIKEARGEAEDMTVALLGVLPHAAEEKVANRWREFHECPRH